MVATQMMFLFLSFALLAALCSACTEDEIVDCNGLCSPRIRYGDAVCDDGTTDPYNGHPVLFDCESLDMDLGDCAIPDVTFVSVNVTDDIDKRPGIIDVVVDFKCTLNNRAIVSGFELTVGTTTLRLNTVELQGSFAVQGLRFAGKLVLRAFNTVSQSEPKEIPVFDTGYPGGEIVDLKFRDVDARPNSLSGRLSWTWKQYPNYGNTEPSEFLVYWGTNTSASASTSSQLITRVRAHSSENYVYWFDETNPSKEFLFVFVNAWNDVGPTRNVSLVRPVDESESLDGAVLLIVTILSCSFTAIAYLIRVISKSQTHDVAEEQNLIQAQRGKPVKKFHTVPILILVSHLQLLGAISCQKNWYPVSFRSFVAAFEWTSLQLQFPNSNRQSDGGTQQKRELLLLSEVSQCQKISAEDRLTNVLTVFGLGLCVLSLGFLLERFCAHTRPQLSKVIPLFAHWLIFSYFGLTLAASIQFMHGSAAWATFVAVVILIGITLGLPILNLELIRRRRRLGMASFHANRMERLGLLQNFSEPFVAGYSRMSEWFVSFVLVKLGAIALALSLAEGSSQALAGLLLFVEVAFFLCLGLQPYANKLLNFIDAIASVVGIVTLCTPVVYREDPEFKLTQSYGDILVALNVFALAIVAFALAQLGVRTVQQIRQNLPEHNAPEPSDGGQTFRSTRSNWLRIAQGFKGTSFIGETGQILMFSRKDTIATRENTQRSLNTQRAMSTQRALSTRRNTSPNANANAKANVNANMAQPRIVADDFGDHASMPPPPPPMRPRSSVVELDDVDPSVIHQQVIQRLVSYNMQLEKSLGPRALELAPSISDPYPSNPTTSTPAVPQQQSSPQQQSPPRQAFVQQSPPQQLVETTTPDSPGLPEDSSPNNRLRPAKSTPDKVSIHDLLPPEAFDEDMGLTIDSPEMTTVSPELPNIVRAFTDEWRNQPLPAIEEEDNYDDA